MKALGGSNLKLFACKKREKESFFWRSREIALIRQESGFLGHRKRVMDCLYLSVSFQHKYIHPFSAASSDQTNVGSEEIQTISSDQLKTVRVRFKLQKECAFGQQFLIVGDDTIVGLWDPSDGVALDWSEGHVWTAEMDLPVGKVIKYKFILKGQTGNILWQPGPDRVLETWDAKKTITVIEDWDNQELQNIIEEDFVVDDVNEESVVDSDSLLVAENLNQPILNEETEVIDKLSNANCHTNMVAKNITEEFDEKDSSLSDKGSGSMTITNQKKEEKALENNGSKLLSSKDEEEVPVLVPGLAPMPVEESKANLVGNNSVDNTYKIEDSTEPERIGKLACRVVMILGLLVAFCFLLSNSQRQNKLEDSRTIYLKDKRVSASVHSTERNSAVTKLKDEDVSASTHSTERITTTTDERVSGLLHSAETSEMKSDEKQPVYRKEKVESNVFESDMQWGLRILRKFLATFGFQ